MRRALLSVALAALVACSAVPPPRRSPYHPADADLSVTRIVHASLIVEMRGTLVRGPARWMQWKAEEGEPAHCR